MTGFKPVTISKGSFAFCRTTIAALLWLSVIFQIRWLVIVIFIIMLLSALLKVKRAPLIVLYSNTFEKIHKSQDIIVDENGLSFSHWVGAIFSLICIAFLFYISFFIGWILTAILAILQISAAFGFCSALKIYSCLNSGGCCRVGKFVKKVKDNHNA